MIITYPREVIKAERTYSYFRDVRHHRKSDMWRELENVDWNVIYARKSNLQMKSWKIFTKSYGQNLKRVFL
jgi:hypothetical protein